MPTPYQITSPYFVAGVEVDEDGYCVRAAPIIGYAVGKEASWFFDYCKKKGWRVVPVGQLASEESWPQTFVFHGVQYDLTWKDNRLVRIIATRCGEEEEITWRELPEQLKGLL